MHEYSHTLNDDSSYVVMEANLISAHAFFSSLSLLKGYTCCLQDYGIDFDDLDHPVKAFRCRCGSKFCRNMKRSTSK